MSLDPNPPNTSQATRALLPWWIENPVARDTTMTVTFAISGTIAIVNRAWLYGLTCACFSLASLVTLSSQTLLPRLRLEGKPRFLVGFAALIVFGLAMTTAVVALAADSYLFFTRRGA